MNVQLGWVMDVHTIIRVSSLGWIVYIYIVHIWNENQINIPLGKLQ
jgi:hypothetical protein